MNGRPWVLGHRKIFRDAGGGPRPPYREPPKNCATRVWGVGSHKDLRVFGAESRPEGRQERTLLTHSSSHSAGDGAPLQEFLPDPPTDRSTFPDGRHSRTFRIPLLWHFRACTGGLQRRVRLVGLSGFHFCGISGIPKVLLWRPSGKVVPAGQKLFRRPDGFSWARVCVAGILTCCRLLGSQDFAGARARCCGPAPQSGSRHFAGLARKEGTSGNGRNPSRFTFYGWHLDAFLDEHRAANKR